MLGSGAVLSEGVVDEHAVVVRVDPQDGKGQLSGNGFQPGLHQGLFPNQQRNGLVQVAQASVPDRLEMKESLMLSRSGPPSQFPGKPARPIAIGEGPHRDVVTTGQITSPFPPAAYRGEDDLISRSKVAALATSSRYRTSESRSRWPCCSMVSTR